MQNAEHALLLSPLGLPLYSSDDEALCDAPEPEQVSHDARALAYSSASGTSCLICLLY